MKSKILFSGVFFLLFLCFFNFSAYTQVGIGTTTPHNSAILELSSQSMGLLMPRTDTSSISNPANGLIIYDTNENAPCYFNGNSWMILSSASNINAGDGLYISNDTIFIDYNTGLDIVGGQLVARVTEALWNANQLQGIGIDTLAPSSGQVLSYNGSSWSPNNFGGLFTAGDGIDITADSISVDITDLLGIGLSEDTSNNILVSYGVISGTAVEGNQTATIIAGTGLSGGILSDTIGDGFIATLVAQTDSALWNANQLQSIGITTVVPSSGQVLSFNGSDWTPNSMGSLFTAGDGIDITNDTLSVNVTDILGTGLSEDASNNIIVSYGTTTGSAVEGSQTATITVGVGLTGGISADALGDGIIATINARYDSALWNANQLQGVGITTVAPSNGQVLSFDGSDWTPNSLGSLITAGDGIDITGDSISVDVTDILGTGLSEDASNNIIVSYGITTGTAVEGNQTATIVAGNGLSGGIAFDSLGDGFTASLSVDYGTATNTAVEGNQVVTITAGIGLTGGTTNDTLGDGFSTTLNAQTTTALWNSNELQGVGITTIAPTIGQVLYYNGSDWDPTDLGGLLNAGDGIDITANSIDVDVTDFIGIGLSETSNDINVNYGNTAGSAVEGNQTATIIAGNGLSGGISGDALGDGFSTSLTVVYGSTANTSVEGSQTATITAGNGLTGGITSDALGDGFSTSLSVLFGTTANTSVEGSQTATIIAGTGLTGGISADVLGDGFTATINAQTTAALWNAIQLQGEDITTIVPVTGQVLAHNGTDWTPTNIGGLLSAGDGIDILGNSIIVDITDFISTGLSEDASNNILVNYGTTSSSAVEGNQTATITAGNGLSGGIASDALGDGFSATLSVNYGTSANTAVEGTQTATINVGGGLTGGISGDVLGDGFSTTINVRYDSALWNANELQGVGISTSTPTLDQVLSYNGSDWNPANLGGLLTGGDGIIITTNTIDVDVTDIIGTGLSEDASNNIFVNYGTAANTAVEGNQTATIIAGSGIAGGISADTLGDGFTATLVAQTDSAYWNANKLQGVGITTTAPAISQVLSYNGSNWNPTDVGGLLNPGDGIDIIANTIIVDVTDFLGTGLSESSNDLAVIYGSTAGTAVEGNQTASIIAGIGLTGGTFIDALGDGFSTTLDVTYGTTANSAVEGDQTATIVAGNGLSGGIASDALGNGFSATLNIVYGTSVNSSVEGDQVATIVAGNGLSGGIASDALGDGFSATLSVDYGIVTNSAVEGDQTASITAGTGLTGGISLDVLGDGFSTTLNAQTTTALWNANQLYGTDLSSTAPANGQILRYGGTYWAPVDPNWAISGTDIYNSNTGNIGIGTSSPARKLHISDVMRLQPRATVPASPSAGDIYYNSTDNKLKVFDGTIWQDCY